MQNLEFEAECISITGRSTTPTSDESTNIHQPSATPEKRSLGTSPEIIGRSCWSYRCDLDRHQCCPLQTSIIQQRLGTSPAELETLCQKWHLTELSLFGSILRDDFRPDSDIDLLASFSPSFNRGLTETLQIREDFAALFKRKIDLVIKDAIERSPNWSRRQEILETAKVIYVAK